MNGFSPHEVITEIESSRSNKKEAKQSLLPTYRGRVYVDVLHDF